MPALPSAPARLRVPLRPIVLPTPVKPAESSGALSSHATVQRALTGARNLAPVEVLRLQSVLGNRAVHDLLRGQTEPRSSLRVGASQDGHEQVARQAAQEMRAHAHGPAGVQRAADAAPEVGQAGGAISRDLEQNIQRAKSGGRPVPDQVRLAMEKRTGVDYGNVRVHEGKQADVVNRALGARAATVGKHIFLGKGQSPHDVQLMAHELTHTTQQGATKPGKDAPQQSAPEGVPGIQRDDEDDLKKTKKKLRGAKIKKGLAKAGQYGLKGLDWLTTAPLRVIDQASVLDLHFKDFGNFVRTGKTRSKRMKPRGGKTVDPKYNKGKAKRELGRTGLRAYLSGLKYHKMIYGSATKDMSLPWMGWANPFTAIGRGTQQAKKYAKGKDKKIETLRGQKRDIQDRIAQGMIEPEVEDIQQDGIQPEDGVQGEEELVIQDYLNQLEDDEESE